MRIHQIAGVVFLLQLLLVSGFPSPAVAELRKDVPFVKRGERELKLDIQFEADQKMRPAVLFIHGGGWRRGRRQVYHESMKKMARQGYVAATVEYRLTETAAWPAQLEDVRAAQQWLVEHAAQFGIDPERIGVMGHSAGGHLSLMLGVTPTEKGESLRVRGVVNFFGPTDLRTVKQVEHARETIEALVGGKLEDRLAVMKELSPITHVDRGDAPVLTFHGTEDKLVRFRQAEILHKALDKAKIPNRLQPMEGVAHGVGGDRTKIDEQVNAFLRDYLQGGDLPLLAHEDFDQSPERWQATDSTAWKRVSKGGRTYYSLTKNSKYQPMVRSPLNIALLRDVEVGDFVLDVDLRSTNDPYGHQDLCLFFGHQDPEHFYYVHIGRRADPHANSIFLVNGKPRVSIAQKRTDGTDWSRGWHRARIRRDAASGRIEVYFDDMQKPIMTTVDKTFAKGRIGVGSFDDTGDFDAIRLWGR